jgi:tRNA(Ile2) C34 agmatinyltransferase TiaS
MADDIKPCPDCATPMDKVNDNGNYKAYRCPKCGNKPNIVEKVYIPPKPINNPQ